MINKTKFTHPYLSRHYADALACDQQVVVLPDSAIPLILRSVETERNICDAAGPYPITPLLTASLSMNDEICMRDHNIASLSCVSDVFYAPDDISWWDHAVDYKEHYIRQLRENDDYSYTKHHRYEVRRSLRYCEVRLFTLADYLEQWCALYDRLIERHQMTGVSAFSHAYFSQLAEMPELVCTGAFDNNQLISAHLWLAYEGYVYSHLAASSDRGYELRAAYPIYDLAIRHFTGKGAHYIDFGGGAGNTTASQGLIRFKKGFCNETRTNKILGKIIMPERYEELCSSLGRSDHYFPAYRG